MSDFLFIKMLKYCSYISAQLKKAELYLCFKRGHSVLNFSGKHFITNHRSFTCRGKNDKKLFTPGPLTTSSVVKEAMQRDLGSRDTEFINIVKEIRKSLLEIANVTADDYTSVLLQGSGTYAVEAVLQTTNNPKSKCLILSNGAYGKRMTKICQVANINYHALNFEETQSVDPSVVRNHLQEVHDYSLVAIVHCETSTGIMNPIKEIGKIVQEYNSETSYFIDAMSSFGAVPVSMKDVRCHYLVSSANKCLEGIPGFSFVIASKSRLLNCKGNCHSLCLDLVDQYEGLESNGQFRFTPPTHSLIAFQKALMQFVNENGVTGRAKRYKENNVTLRKGMQKLGFKELLDPKDNGYIITTFHFPNHPNFTFTDFYNRLNNLDQVIYPGKVTNAECFRIGNIGQLYPKDLLHLLECIEKVCKDMGIPIPIN